MGRSRSRQVVRAKESGVMRDSWRFQRKVSWRRPREGGSRSMSRRMGIRTVGRAEAERSWCSDLNVCLSACQELYLGRAN